MNSSTFKNTSGSVFTGGLVASLLSAVAVYLLTSSAPMAQHSAYLLTRHITFSTVIFAAVFAVLWQSSGIILGLYNTARESPVSSFGRALEFSIAMTVLLGLCMVLTIPRPPLLQVMADFLACAFACELVRLGIIIILRERSRRVVIVGGDRLAAKAWREFRVHRYRHMKVVGFVNQAVSSEMTPDIASRCLGDIEALPRIVLDQDIDDVIIAMPVASHSQVLEQSIAAAGTLGTRILCLKDICGIHPESIVRDYGEILFDLVPAPELGGIEQAPKRIFDVAVSAMALLIGSFIFLPVTVLSLLQRRLIAYRPQVQLGFRRRKYKRWRLCSDPGSRRIRLFLELLPTMWNVLCGYMSLIGPPPVSEAEAAHTDIAALAGRFNVRPGVIGDKIADPIADASATTNTQGTSNWSLRTDVKALARALRIEMERSAAIESEAGAL